MKLALVGIVCAAAGLAGVARADTSLEEYGVGTGRGPSTQIYEASCDLDLELRGAVASVEVRRKLANPGPTALAATFAFDLPPGATLTGFALRTGSATEQALAVPSNPDTAPTGALGADPALLTALPAEASSQYAVRLQPIAPEHDVTLIVRYTLLAQVRAGALRLVLPGSPGSGKVTACRGSIRAVAGPGATIEAIQIGELRTRGAAASFVLDATDVVIDAHLAFAGKQPVVWTQAEPLADGWSATLLTVAAPPIRAPSIDLRRALFVIDGSRSMELVGRHNVSKVIRTVAGLLPATTELDAIIYDRTATRVFGDWRAATPQTLAGIDAAVTGHAALNGSDVAGALRLAHEAIAAPARGATMVIVISDGVVGEVEANALTHALDATSASVDVLAVVLDPARTRSPGAAALAAPVHLYGGSFVEVNVDELDTALTVVDEWLRPSWLELAVAGAQVPRELRAGSGFTQLILHHGAPGKLVLTGHAEAPIKIAPRFAPAAPIAALALATTTDEDFMTDADSDRHRGAVVRAHAVAAHPYVSQALSFAVLTTSGRVAGERHVMVKGGGPYQRIIEIDDPHDRTSATTLVASTPPPVASAIAPIMLERLFRDQLQPRAYACYQRALGTSPKLAGTVWFELRMGRGEITEVQLTGLGDPHLDACLLDAAYAMQLPLPDFTINADDQTLAHYPLTFNVADSHPTIVLGDADSTSPIDIDALPGGVPAKRGAVKVDSKTPLGRLRPTK